MIKKIWLNIYFTNYEKTTIFRLADLCKTDSERQRLMSFENMDSFTTFLAARRGLAETTIRAYRYDLEYFDRWIRVVGKKVEDIGPKDLDQYVQYMRKELNLEAKTCKRRIAAISTYYKWMVREEFLKNDPVYFIELPKAPSRLPVYLNENEISLFMKYAEEEAEKRPVIGARNRALFYLMMFAGLRVSEALAIKENNITIQDGYPVMVTVIGKGNKERQVPLNEEIARALLAWIETKHALRDDEELARKYTRKSKVELVSDFLFPGRDGKSLNKYTVQVKMKEIRNRFFGEKKLTPHKLRHTFATALFKNEVDIKTIQELLGHSSIATTQIYTHVENEQKRDAVMKLKRNNKV